MDCESGEGRDKLFKYTIDTYGIEKCAAVSTFGIRKARSAIRDVGRLYEIDLKEIVRKKMTLFFYLYNIYLVKLCQYKNKRQEQKN